MKKRGQGKCRRILAGLLCLCVLFTIQLEIWNRFSVFAAEESDTKVVLSFAELSEEIKEQTVPVGTVYEELELPEELVVFMKHTEISSTPNMAEEESEEETVSGNDPETGSKEEEADVTEEITVYTLENFEKEVQETTAGVTWQSDPAYDGNTEETYIFTAVLPEGYTLAENVNLPQITVTVKESSQVMAADNASHKHCICGGNINIGDHTTHTEDIVYDNILTSDNGQLLINGTVQSNYTLTTGKYYLANDVALNSELIIAGKSEVYICLNNHTISYNRANGKHRVITVENEATLNLCTCGDSGGITGGDTDESGGGLYLSASSIFNMYGGSIEGNVADTGSGGIFSGKDVSCNLYKVNICGNKGNQGGGILFSGILNIYGGEIKNNEAVNFGGGIATGSAEDSILQDVKICHNTAGNYAGGLYCSNGNLTMSDVEISNNIVSNSTARYPAGGVALMQGTISISGSIIISGNQYNGEHNNFWNYCNTRNPSKLIIADDLDEQSVIGLTNNTVPTEADPTPVEVAIGNSHTITPADWSRFFSDKDGYEILMDGANNRLLLCLPGSCDLGGLDLSASGATLSPEFKADTTEYTSMVANSVDEVGITATLAGTASGADIKIKINDGAETSMDSGVEKMVPLNEGKNTIAITVTSGGMSKTYTVEITREEAKGYSVTITAYKDGEAWRDNQHTYKLASSNGSSVVTDLDAVPDGTYHIYDSDIDTGVTVKVEGAEATARVDYYTVTFYDGNTELTAPAQQIVLKGAAASAPPNNPTKTGYTFSKWVTADSGSTEYDFANETVTGKTSVYASWTPVSYSITYILDGGNVSGNPTSYTIESSAITLNNPTKKGFTFTGWEGTGLTGETNTTVTIPKGSTGNRTYTAHWELHWELKDYTVILHTNGGTGGTDLTSYTFGTGAVLPTNWTKTGYVFDGWYDNEGCIGTAVTSISATDTGNKEYWAKWTDNIAPVIGMLTYNYQPKNLWQWLIGKESLIITVPVTEEGSGADKITYTVTPDGGTASAKTAAIKNGVAEITVSADFKGTILITCTDKAGNTSASMTVGTKGIIIEDEAPKIAFQAENAKLLPSGEYKTVPDIVVTIADDKDNAIFGGIASVSYKIGDGTVKPVTHDYTTSMVVSDSFTIPASEIPADGAVISVTATDNAGNSVTQNYTVKVHTHSGTLVPEVKPTCTTAGNEQHYTCTCGKLFSDSGCTNEITDHASVIVGKLGHDFSGQYLFDVNGHWKVCSRCNAAQTSESHVFDDDNDTTCNKCDYRRTIGTHTHSVERAVAATEPTCTTAGNKAYYICSCGKWFSDSVCTKEVTAQDVSIPAKGHTADTDPAKAATCTGTGLTEGSRCSVCGHVIKAQTVTAALGHDYGNYHYDAGGHWKVCRRCGAASAKHDHNYDNDRDTQCKDCGWVRAISDSNNEQDEQPTPTPTPEPPVPSQPTTQPSRPTNPPEQPQPPETPEDKQEPESARTPEPTVKPPETEKEQQPEQDGRQTVPVSIDNGTIVISGEPVATGNVKGMTDTSTVLNLGNGAVIVTVVCAEQEYTAGVADTIAVANAILTPEQMELVNNGETIEIRIDVKDISDQVPEQDKEVIENGIEEYRKEVPGLVLGMYVDISMFIRIGEGGWNAITATKEPIEIIVGIPEKLQEKGRSYVIIRAHDGVHTLMDDLDDDPSTITVNTDLFSSYAIAYVQAEGAGHKCSLCHICPTFLGICYFVWLAIILVLILIIWIIIRRNSGKQDEQEG